MSYSIGEFAQLLGLSADTIRYYEKLGLCSAERDPANNYRRYSERDALAFMNLKACRSLEMGIDEMFDATRELSVAEQSLWLVGMMAAAEAEIARLQRRVERIEELRRFYSITANRPARLGEIERTKTFCLYTLGAGAKDSTGALRLAKAWMDNLPFTFVATGITRESFLAGSGDLGLRLGVGVIERYREKLGLPLGPAVEEFPAGRGVFLRLETRDYFSIGRKELSPLLSYIEERRLKVIGDVTGRLFASEYREGSLVYHLSFRVLVE
jgi:DNA-binding transcriptional MerR regulator